VAVIEMHISPADSLYCAEAHARMYFYPPPYYSGGSWYYIVPWLWYDGDPHGGNIYSTWRSKIVAEMNRPAPFTCTMWGIYTPPNGVVYAKFRNDSTHTVTGRIRFVLTEDSIYYSAPNGDLWHNHVARDYLPDTSGTPVTLAPGESITVSRNFTIQSNWNANKCEIVAWIQSNIMLPDSTKDIWQGGMIKVSQLTYVEENNFQNSVFAGIKSIPNPCVKHTKFSFKLNKGELYRISIFDVTGRCIRDIMGYASGDNQVVEWNLKTNTGETLNSGVYLYRFESLMTNESGKIVIR